MLTGHGTWVSENEPGYEIKATYSHGGCHIALSGNTSIRTDFIYLE